MSKLVVDTCVFIEGIFSMEEMNSSSLFLSEVDSDGSRLIFSMEMIGELLYILKRQCNSLSMSYNDTNEILTTAVAWFQNGKSINTRRTNSPAQAKDPDDQMFIDAAFESSATHIITLDKKSGILELANVPFTCVTPVEYLELKKIESSKEVSN